MKASCLYALYYLFWFNMYRGYSSGCWIFLIRFLLVILDLLSVDLDLCFVVVVFCFCVVLCYFGCCLFYR